ncbi:MAG: DNA repair exonuclease [Candidatus Riflebacteria bacterium]|nr:DNA repair exonuclease [Candidatus Riflebacteria bacterium]
MFKFIHAADIHLDSPLRGLSRYETAPEESIRGACRRAFSNLVDLAISEKAEFVLLAGDLYDGDWRDYNTGIFLNQQIGRLNRNKILVYAIAGNHDALNPMTQKWIKPENLKIFSSENSETFKLPNLNTAIHGKSFESSNSSLNLANTFPEAERGMFNVGLLHTSLTGREGHDPYAPCTITDLCLKRYQYWALGHIHKQEVVSEDPWIIFPGCIQGRHIRETGPKGCILVKVENNSVSSVEKRPLDVFRWDNCIVDISDDANEQEIFKHIQDSIEKKLASSEGRHLAIRVRIEGKSSVSETFASNPERIESQVRALGAEISSDNLWIEKIENASVGRTGLNSIVSEDNAFGNLLTRIREIPEKAEQIDGLPDAIESIRRALAHTPDSAANLRNEDNIQRLIAEAKQMLIGRLLTNGGEK